MHLIIYLFIFLLGFFRYHHTHRTYLDYYEKISNHSMSITGVVTDISQSKNGRYPFIISLANQDGYTFLIYVKSCNIQVGDHITTCPLYIRRCDNSEYRLYLLKEGSIATIFSANFSYTLNQRPILSWRRTLHQYRAHFVERLRNKLSPATYALYASIFLGNKELTPQLMDTIRDDFNIWGIGHYLARSGLHVIILIFLCMLVLRFIPIPWYTKDLLLLLLLGFYWLLSWGSISFMRAFLTCLLYRIFNLCAIPTYALHIITLVTVLILCYNPLQLLFLDFQLSFALTAALAWYTMYAKPRDALQQPAR